jgi:hypothetical protein
MIFIIQSWTHYSTSSDNCKIAFANYRMDYKIAVIHRIYSYQIIILKCHGSLVCIGFFFTVKIMIFSTKSIVFYSRVIAITQLGEYNTRL